jgi:hypothetical protein
MIKKAQKFINRNCEIVGCTTFRKLDKFPSSGEGREHHTRRQNQIKFPKRSVLQLFRIPDDEQSPDTQWFWAIYNTVVGAMQSLRVESCSWTVCCLLQGTVCLSATAYFGWKLRGRGRWRFSVRMCSPRLWLETRPFACFVEPNSTRTTPGRYTVMSAERLVEGMSGYSKKTCHSRLHTSLVSALNSGHRV